MGGTLQFLLLATFVSAISFPLLQKQLKGNAGLALSTIPLLTFVLLIIKAIQLPPGSAIIIESSLQILQGVNFSLRIDGLTILFGLLVSGIGCLVLMYSSYYMAKQEQQSRFYLFMMVFMGGMTGLIFSDNLLALFIFWEITSVASFLLIGYNHHDEKSRTASFNALLITGFGGLSLLFAVILIGNITGTYNISEILSQTIHIGNHPHYYLILVLVIIAGLTKSAQFPFHFWLPGAMHAPAPVSAYLHSATMVNAGIFLLLRLNPVIGGTVAWDNLLMLTGSLTMLTGVFFAIGQSDLKRILAFTTISALGTMVLLVGIDTILSYKALFIFLIVHATYKGGLFMIAGIIDKHAGTRDIYLVNGALRKFPVISAAFLLAILSMAGLPPMLGFISKELIYGAKIGTIGISWFSISLSLAANMVMVAISINLAYQLLVISKTKAINYAGLKENSFPWHFLAGPVTLSIISLVLGIAPFLLEHIISGSLYFSRGVTVNTYLTLWHGFNKVLLLSLLTLVGGLVIYKYRLNVLKIVHQAIDWLNKFHMPTMFARLITVYAHAAAQSTGKVQHGYHRFYLLTFFMVAIGLIAFQLHGFRGISPDFKGLTPIKPHVLLIIIIASLSVLFAVLTKSRLSAILAMGFLGYGIGMIYLFHGAVDLAITQFLVETIVMVLFVMVIYYLPKFAVLSSNRSRARDAILSAIVGIFITLVLLHTGIGEQSKPVSSYFIENAYTMAKGRNVVNTILVDFRALDTLGEMVVLTMAAAGVFSLFRFQIKRLKKSTANKDLNPGNKENQLT